MTMTLISTVTVTAAGGVANITFSSIPQTATDLVILFSGRCTVGWIDYTLLFNGSATGFTRQTAGVSQGGLSASRGTNNNYLGAINNPDHVANTFASNTIYIPNYAGSANKAFLIDGVNENTSSNVDMRLNVGGWANTAAINSITIATITDNIAQYSSASLYTITKGTGGANVA